MTRQLLPGLIVLVLGRSWSLGRSEYRLYLHTADENGRVLGDLDLVCSSLLTPFRIGLRRFRRGRPPQQCKSYFTLPNVSSFQYLASTDNSIYSGMLGLIQVRELVMDLWDHPTEPILESSTCGLGFTAAENLTDWPQSDSRGGGLCTRKIS